MGDRWYSQQEGKNGYEKAKVGRRLKADIVASIIDILDLDALPSLDKMTNQGLETLEAALNNLRYTGFKDV